MRRACFHSLRVGDVVHCWMLEDYVLAYPSEKDRFLFVAECPVINIHPDEVIELSIPSAYGCRDYVYISPGDCQSYAFVKVVKK